jgi:hypothetical protein
LLDVSVTLKGDATAYGETQQTFPLFADGYEIVVQGLLEEHESTSEHSLQAVTTTATTDGITSWTVTAVQDSSTMSQAKNSLCFQSYAHARVTQLLRLCDASEFFGIDILAELVSLSDPCTTDLADCIEEEAMSLALEANVVAKGLTGMVTVFNENCLSFEGETEICRDGTRADEYYEDYGVTGASYSRQTALPKLIFLMLCIWFTLKTLL